MKLDKFSWDWFGEAKTVTVTKEQTTIVDGKGTVEKLKHVLKNYNSKSKKHKPHTK